MNILLIGNSYVSIFKPFLQDTCPKVQVEEVGHADTCLFGSPRQKSFDVIVMGNRDLRCAERFKEIYPDAALVLLLLADEPEYRTEAERSGIDHILIMPDLTSDTIRQTICPYS